MIYDYRPGCIEAAIGIIIVVAIAIAFGLFLFELGLFAIAGAIR